MDPESSDCSCETVKVEIVNRDSLEDKVREKVLLAVAGGLVTLFLEQGATAIARAIISYRKKKAAEIKDQKKD